MWDWFWGIEMHSARFYVEICPQSLWLRQNYGKTTYKNVHCTRRARNSRYFQRSGGRPSCSVIYAKVGLKSSGLAYRAPQFKGNIGIISENVTEESIAKTERLLLNDNMLNSIEGISHFANSPLCMLSLSVNSLQDIPEEVARPFPLLMCRLLLSRS